MRDGKGAEQHANASGDISAIAELVGVAAHKQILQLGGGQPTTIEYDHEHAASAVHAGWNIIITAS